MMMMMTIAMMVLTMSTYYLPDTQRYLFQCSHISTDENWCYPRYMFTVEEDERAEKLGNWPKVI